MNVKKLVQILAFSASSMFAQLEEVPSLKIAESPADKAVVKLLESIRINAEEIKNYRRTQASDTQEINKLKAKLDKLEYDLLELEKGGNKTVSELQNKTKGLTDKQNEFTTQLGNQKNNLSRVEKDAEKNVSELRNNIKKHSEEIGIVQNNQVVSETELNSRQNVLKKQFVNLQSAIDKIDKKTIQTEVVLHNNIKGNSNEIFTVRAELESKVGTVNQCITNTTAIINKNRMLWIIVVLLVIFLVFVFLKRMLIQQNRELLKKIDEGGLKLDGKLVEIIESQIEIMKDSDSGGNIEDHSLVLKVADEVVRIQKNLARMDEKTKGLRQLAASVKRITDNLTSNGYELVELLGKPFNDGMKLTANFIPDEALEEDQQIITRIIKPQVNYKGVMIQSAQVEVSQGC